MMMAFDRRGWPVGQFYEDGDIWRWSIRGSIHGRALCRSDAISAAQLALNRRDIRHEWRPRR